jgi:hypothetical protein
MRDLVRITLRFIFRYRASSTGQSWANENWPQIP